MYNRSILRIHLVVRHTIEALRAGQSRPEISTVIFRFVKRNWNLVTRNRLALVSCALLLCINVVGAYSAPGQAAARPAPAATPAAIQVGVTEAPVDSTIPDDAAVDKMLETYSPKVRALELVIGKLKGDLRKSGVGAGSLGNFVADGIRAESSLKLGQPILLAVTNSGGLRKNAISEGDLTLRDVFELLPFENALVAFDLTGAQVLDLLRVVVSNRDAQSGARIKYRVNSDKQLEVESAKLLIDGLEKEIDPKAVYTVISIDYLLNVTGGDYAAVLKQATNTRPLGLTIRDAITNFVKAETAAGRDIKSTLDGRFVFDKRASAAEEPPQ
jgi:2',3'-cyclic-nucleotide 2'-phosphodiesterase (5'-nucleotidase family)